MPGNDKSPYSHLPAFDEDSGDLNVIVETPKGSRNKFDYSSKLGIFKLGSVLPTGTVFPYDFGFVPSTQGGDGDPLDVLLLMDEPAFTGCLVSARLIGVIEAEQTERDGETIRNDRLIAVATNSRNHAEVRSLKDLSDNLVDEIEHFFVSYNEAKGKEFKPLGRFGPDHTERVVRQGMEQPKGSSYRKSGGKAKGRSKKS